MKSGVPPKPVRLLSLPPDLARAIWRGFEAIWPPNSAPAKPGIATTGICKRCGRMFSYQRRTDDPLQAYCGRCTKGDRNGRPMA